MRIFFSLSLCFRIGQRRASVSFSLSFFTHALSSFSSLSLSPFSSLSLSLSPSLPLSLSPPLRLYSLVESPPNPRSERSKQVNESRLKVLRAREEALASALAAAKAAAATRASADAGRYKALLVDLALQAVHKLGEPEAVLVGRKCDAALLPEVAAAAAERFEATFGKKAPKISASTSTAEGDFLPPPPSEAGGEGAPSW